MLRSVLNLLFALVLVGCFATMMVVSSSLGELIFLMICFSVSAWLFWHYLCELDNALEEWTVLDNRRRTLEAMKFTPNLNS